MLRDDVRDRVAAHAATSAARLAREYPRPAGRRRRGTTCAKSDDDAVDEAVVARLLRRCTSGRAASPRRCARRGCPVSSAIRPSTVSRMCRRSSACTSTSTAEPPMPGRSLVHQDPRVRQRPTLARRARRQQELPGAAGEPERERRHVVGDQPHHVADREHRRHRAARRVDPQGDVGCLVLGREREQLRRDQRAVVVVERAVEHEHALVEQLAPRLGAELGDLALLLPWPQRARRRGTRRSADPLRAAPPWADRPRSPRPACARRGLLTRVTLWPGPALLETSARRVPPVAHPPGRSAMSDPGIRAVDARRAPALLAVALALGMTVAASADRECRTPYRRQRAGRGEARERGLPGRRAVGARRPRDVQCPGRARAPHRRERSREDASSLPVAVIASRNPRPGGGSARLPDGRRSGRRHARRALVFPRVRRLGRRRPRHHPHRAAGRRARRAVAGLPRARRRALHRRTASC